MIHSVRLPASCPQSLVENRQRSIHNDYARPNHAATTTILVTMVLGLSGVAQLINRLDGKPFDQNDDELFEVGDGIKKVLETPKQMFILLLVSSSFVCTLALNHVPFNNISCGYLYDKTSCSTSEHISSKHSINLKRITRIDCNAYQNAETPLIV